MTKSELIELVGKVVSGRMQPNQGIIMVIIEDKKGGGADLETAAINIAEGKTANILRMILDHIDKQAKEEGKGLIVLPGGRG